MNRSATQKIRMPLKQAMTQWCEIKGISPADFSKTMGITYQHAWGLLSGEREFSDAMLGLFVKSYGVDAAKEVLVMCGLEHDERLSVLERPEDDEADQESAYVLALDVPRERLEK